jgi:peptidoglycan-associated lipoprotein
MKQSCPLLRGLVALLFSLMLGACHSPTVGRDVPASLQAAVAAVPLEPAATATATAIDASQAPAVAGKPGQESRPNCRTCNREHDPLDDPGSPLAKREIFFGFDQYQLTPEAQALLDHHAKYLASHPQRRLRLEGHADQRGGREYNLALGQKRADAVVRALMLLGVAERQVEAVSFGKEQPAAQGHDEAAWAQNRRVDLVYQR